MANFPLDPKLIVSYDHETHTMMFADGTNIDFYTFIKELIKYEDSDCDGGYLS